MNGDLIVRTATPLCAETRLSAQVGLITPNDRFYVRNHFSVPRIDADSWSLSVHGHVRRHLTLTLADIRRLPSQSLLVTLECAGNGRSMLEPSVAGEPWDLGAVSTAEWTGVPLVELLDRAGVAGAAREVVFRGVDHNTTGDRSDTFRFERSLPIEAAQESEALLAYAMNGEPLSPNHGFPLRLIVPGWYAMASVKWLGEIAVTDQPFRGYFQADRYVIEGDGGAGDVVEPLTRVRVRSVITEPERGDVVRRGELVIRGYAWSGNGAIKRVDVDIGEGWHVARLLDDAHPYAWRRWEITKRVDKGGRITLRSRATDSNGLTQPEQAAWNRLGYANNAIQTVPIEVFD
jgi:DMSO/TMAO reductase YedYZ molybdopterin-dependent catalytic subunit